ncbi:MAG: aspartyl/asparaginyl beta-hydroxylase domain-containing protein [Pseudomonadota bacterium]
MDIDVPLKDWGEFDVAPLREAILSQEDAAWLESSQRQDDYEVHNQTESIVMLFASQTWPAMTVTREAGWERLQSVAHPLMDEIIDKHYKPGGTIIRAVAAKLKAGATIAPHFDSLPSFKYGHRIHIPITTNRRVRFMIDGRPFRFEIGRVYEINNRQTHSVINAGKEDRITFIFDYIAPDVAREQNVVITHG